jgi:subfamily B ATP-binding cassette protein HlyB/CyaB
VKAVPSESKKLFPAGVAPKKVEMPLVDPGMAALAIVAAHYRITADPYLLAHEAALGVRLSYPSEVVRAAQKLGLKSRLVEGLTLAQLTTVPLPAILYLKDGGFLILVARPAIGVLRLLEPVEQKVIQKPAEDVQKLWSGEIVLITRRAGGPGIDPARFSFYWFIPSLWRYRKPFFHVLIASLFIQLFAVITPLFFQLVIDKVLLHNSLSTLLVVVVGLAMIGLFDSVLQYLRTYALAHTTSRIDVELGTRLFDHLLKLPLGYFETRAAGQTVARVRELETIRNFLTGQGLSSVIDLFFTVILFMVLLEYSVTLTLIVLTTIPLYLIIGAAIRPLLREKIKERFNRGADSQQFLVESIVGIQTLKAAAVEPILRAQWEEKLAAYVRTSFEAVSLANIGQNAIQYVSRITVALILYFGALEVIDGVLTVGGLVAFNMIMTQVTAPILRLSQLWQDFQQVQVSVDRLGDILNAASENAVTGNASLPPAKGAIAVSNLTFRYRSDQQEVLRDINLFIPAQQVVGIVGPSGSGKSTLTKLIQRLYRPEKGQIMLDGIDIGQVDTAWLRRQIGVVLQDNLLFSRTIHDNIALGVPSMARAQVIECARLAGADAFIAKLARGYDTQIEERGTNLSGGQRQRIAIARALATQPRILIMDEATSSLDYESERIIQTNMRQIAAERTVIIIAHRLAAVRHCDRIIAFNEGAVVEEGTHDELLGKSDGLYARLWRMQEGGVEQ